MVEKSLKRTISPAVKPKFVEVVIVTVGEPLVVVNALVSVVVDLIG